MIQGAQKPGDDPLILLKVGTFKQEYRFIIFTNILKWYLPRMILSVFYPRP